MTIYGYARVSTDGQTLDAQLAALKAAGAEKVYSEKVSGAKTDRAALSRVLTALGSGDGRPLPIDAAIATASITAATRGCW